MSSQDKFQASVKRVNEATTKINAARHKTIMINKPMPMTMTTPMKKSKKSKGRVITQSITINGETHEHKVFVAASKKTSNQEFIAKMNRNLKK